MPYIDFLLVLGLNQQEVDAVDLSYKTKVLHGKSMPRIDFLLIMCVNQQDLNAGHRLPI